MLERLRTEAHFWIKQELYDVILSQSDEMS